MTCSARAKQCSKHVLGGRPESDRNRRCDLCAVSAHWPSPISAITGKPLGGTSGFSRGGLRLKDSALTTEGPRPCRSGLGVVLRTERAVNILSVLAPGGTDGTEAYSDRRQCRRSFLALRRRLALPRRIDVRARRARRTLRAPALRPARPRRSLRLSRVTRCAPHELPRPRRCDARTGPP